MDDIAMPAQEAPLLDMRDVRKVFGAVVALDHADLTLFPGSIHALIGENGAGKSTLVKIMSGVHQRDGGEFHFRGEPKDFRSTHESRDDGISVIYQEPTLFPHLSVTENIFMGRQYVDSLGQLDQKRMRREAAELFAQLGAQIDPDRPVLGLSIADQQLVEIAKSISMDSQVLIMDEPTAALSGVEVDRLFATARTLRDQGRALVFISHRLDEVLALCDSITVMRDGCYVGTWPAAEVTTDDLVRHMVGREVSTLFPKTEGTRPGETVLRVEHLSSAGVFDDISFEIREGEIVGLAGLVGAGRSETARAIFGVDTYTSGTVFMDGKQVVGGRPQETIAARMAMIPEDRRIQGLHLEMPIGRNITLVMRKALARFGLLTSEMEDPLAAEWATRLQVKARDVDASGATLSGGNQQKVVIAKWLATKPRLLIIDEPTRGIDVGTKSEVHRILDRLACDGMAVLMISSELEEVLAMSDRLLVMHEGRITGQFKRGEASSEAIMSAMTRTTEMVGAS